MKLILIMFFCLATTKCHALFGIEALKKDVHNIGTQNKSIVAELGVIKDNQIELSNKIDSNIQANVKAFAGLDKSFSQNINAGRDVTQNESSVIVKMIDAFKAIALGLIGLLTAIVGAQKIYINNLIKSNLRKTKELEAYREKNGELVLKGEKK